MLRNVWHDPVWSKVIASAILAAVGSALVWLDVSHAEHAPAPKAVISRYSRFAVVSDISDGVTALAFTQHGRLLVVGTGEGKILVWNTSEKRIVNTILAHKKAVSSLSFSADGSLLASASRDETVKLWHFPTGVPEAVWRAAGARHALAFSPVQDVLALGDVDGLALYKVLRGDAVKVELSSTLPSPGTAWPSRVAFRPDGTSVAMAGQSGIAQTTLVPVWNTKNWTMVHMLRTPSDIYDISVSPGGLLASGGSDKAITVWDLEQGKVVYTLVGHAGPVTAVAFSPDGEELASGADDRKIYLWGTRDRELLETVDTVDNTVSPIEFSPNNGRFLAAGVYTDLVIWARN